ncbi:hypothetical protein PHJA_001834800 [Phtheirospermum japonicum]|uniref:Uncharacterized protein n=1 Tax=Phtheirospermum japonicum TaxID=374723 RepID=A0A830C864_9LAMI|nr:hypothetical protein PHJA_001834800 [Phtheirospermum japonicum]
MAYVDHAFSISDEDIMMETSYAVSNKPPIKEISLAVALFVCGALGIVLGIFMARQSNRRRSRPWLMSAKLHFASVDFSFVRYLCLLSKYLWE